MGGICCPQRMDDNASGTRSTPAPLLDHKTAGEITESEEGQTLDPEELERIRAMLNAGMGN